jgi:hypothetical protein
VDRDGTRERGGLFCGCYNIWGSQGSDSVWNDWAIISDVIIVLDENGVNFESIGKKPQERTWNGTKISCRLERKAQHLPVKGEWG